MKKGCQNYDERRIAGYEADGRGYYRRFRGASVAGSNRGKRIDLSLGREWLLLS